MAECRDNNDYNDCNNNNNNYYSSYEDEKKNDGNGDDGGGQKLPARLAAIKSTFARLGRASHNSHTQVIAIHCCCRCCFHFHFLSLIRSLNLACLLVCLAGWLSVCLPA